MRRLRSAGAEPDLVDIRRLVYGTATGPCRYFETPGYASAVEAEQAWCRRRREAWAATRRMAVPAAASAYDFITFDASRLALSHVQNHGALPAQRTAAMAEVEAALTEDRELVELFREEEPEAAATIEDFLDQLLADHAIVRHAMRDFVAGGYDGYSLLTAPSRHTYGRSEEVHAHA